MTRSRAAARPQPSAPPASARSACSARSSRATRARVAPSARRMLSSCSRAKPRASSRQITFTAGQHQDDRRRAQHGAVDAGGALTRVGRNRNRLEVPRARCRLHPRELGVGGGPVDTWPQAREDLDDRRRVLRGAPHRDPQIGGDADEWIGELRRHHADHGAVDAIDLDDRAVEAAICRTTGATSRRSRGQAAAGR